MPRYHTVLFDADNTLLDFSRSERAALSDALASMQVKPTEEMLRAYSAINTAVWKKLERGEISKAALRVVRFEEFCERFSLSLNVPDLALAYTDFLSQKAYLIEGADEVCQALAAHCRLYIITNGLQSVQERRFDACSLKPFFRETFISEEIGFEKPRAEFFEAVARRIPDFSAVDTLVVGDSLSSDIKGGVNAGLDTCWFNPQGLPLPDSLRATYTIKKLEDLLPLVLG